MRRVVAFVVLPALLGVIVGGSASAADLFNVPVRINMGGVETVDSFGRVWLGDGPGPGDPLNIRPDDLGGANWIENWCAPLVYQLDSLDLMGFDSTNLGDQYIFNSVRWDDAAQPPDFYMEIPLPEGTYTVNMYFNEGCCTFRHFKIELQGEIVDDDVSYLDYDPTNPAVGRAGVLSFPDIAVGADQILRIGLLPCFGCPGATDGNAIIDALEIVSGPGCDHLGLDLNCTYDPSTDSVAGTWNPLAGADGFKVLKNGQQFGNILPQGTGSFTDSNPRSGGPMPNYVVQALDGGVPFSECRCSVNTVVCPSGLTCTVDEVSRQVALSWKKGGGLSVTGFEVRRDGGLLQTLPADATTYEDQPAGRDVQYTVTPLTSPAGQCDPMTCQVEIEGNPFSIPLRINMGGAETVDSRGRIWLGDGPGPGDPLNIRPDDLGGANTNVNWCAPVPESLAKLGFDAANPGDASIFGTIRWDAGADGIDFRLEIPVPAGIYLVNMYFIECCCPQRHFKIELQGEIVDDDVSSADYDPVPVNGTVGRLSYRDVTVDDGFIRIALLPCPECPGVGDLNAIIAALEVLPNDPCGDPTFKQCPGNLQCSVDPGTKKVTGSWDPPLCFSPTGYELRRNGDLITTLPGNALTFSDTLPTRVGFYELKTLVPAGVPPCGTMSALAVNSGVSFDVPLRINMGGVFTIDSKGNKWWGDGPGTGDPLDIRVDDAGGTNTIINWCLGAAVSGDDSLRALGWDPEDASDQAIFNSLRWDLGDDGIAGDPSDNIDFRIELPVPNGTYTVNTYFTECCCPFRHFKVELQGEIVADDVNATLYQSPVLPGRTGRLSFDSIVVTNGILAMGFLPCLDCPCPECAVGQNPDINAIIGAIEVLPSGTVVRTCPQGLVCVDAGGGNVSATWMPPENVTLTGYDLYRDGEKIVSLPANATTFEDSAPTQRATVYEVVPLSSDPNFPCPGIRLRCVYMQPGLPFRVPLRINMGARAVADSRGDVWLGDLDPAYVATNPDPLDIRPDDTGGANTVEFWEFARVKPASITALGFDGSHLADLYIFSSIRWDEGGVPPDFLIEIPVENGSYSVNLYFNEDFWTDPTARKYKIQIQDTIVADDFFCDEQGVLQRETFDNVEVTDGILRIGLLPCPECPGVVDLNPILDGIEVLAGGSVVSRFRRGDANADGGMNITDGIYILNYLFLGGPGPSCLESADANDDGSLNITDGIYVLNYLFLGGPAPLAPGPESCGPLPAGSTDMGCDSYTSC